MLALASVLGREFPLDLVERLTGAARRRAARASRRGGGRTRGDRRARLARAALRFTHALVRRHALRRACRRARRLELHRRAGEAIEALAGPDVARISPSSRTTSSAHCPRSTRDEVVEYARRAGDQAEPLLAHEEAARLYESALQALALRAGPGPALERRLLLALGDALARAGRHAEREGRVPAGRRAGAGEPRARRISPPRRSATAAGPSGRARRRPADRRRCSRRRSPHSVTSDTPLRARLLARLAGALTRRARPSPPGRDRRARSRDRATHRRPRRALVRAERAVRRAARDRRPRRPPGSRRRAPGGRARRRRQGGTSARRSAPRRSSTAELNEFDAVRESRGQVRRRSPTSCDSRRSAGSRPRPRHAGAPRRTLRGRGAPRSRRHSRSALARRRSGGRRVRDPALPPAPRAGACRRGARAARPRRRREPGPAVLPLRARALAVDLGRLAEARRAVRGARAERLRDRAAGQRMAPRRRIPRARRAWRSATSRARPCSTTSSLRSPTRSTANVPEGDAARWRATWACSPRCSDRDDEAALPSTSGDRDRRGDRRTPWVAYAQAGARRRPRAARRRSRRRRRSERRPRRRPPSSAWRGWPAGSARRARRLGRVAEPGRPRPADTRCSSAVST